MSMVMLRAIIRPEKTGEVVESLEKAGFPAMTKLDVLGRGKQRGIQVGNTVYDELAKTMVMVVVEEKDASKAMDAIAKAAKTGNYGDGKIFVSPVETAYTIRTGEEGL